MKRKILQITGLIVFISCICLIAVPNKIKGIGSGVYRKISNYHPISPEDVPLSDNIQQTTETQKLAKDAFDAVNAKRKEAGLNELKWSEGIKNAAAIRAQEASTYFSHVRPNGSDWYTADETLLYGENLAKGYNTSNSVVDAWMDSTEHKQNILDAEFETGAIAIYIGKKGEYFWAQEFGY